MSTELANSLAHQKTGNDNSTLDCSLRKSDTASKYLNVSRQFDLFLLVLTKAHDEDVMINT